MSNLAPIRSEDTRARRGAFVREQLRAERWSLRAAAPHVGLSNTALSDRCRGLAPFIAEDLEALALLLHRNPVEFYGEYLAAGNDEKAPTPKGGGSSLPGLDSNQEPIGFKPSNVIEADFGAPQRNVTPRPIVAIGGAR